MTQENLEIELGLYGEYTTTVPIVSIYLDDRLLDTFKFSESSKKTIIKKFNVAVDMHSNHELKIEFLNRPDNGTVRHMHTKQILSVMQIVLNKLVINGVNCLAYKDTQITYFPEDFNKPFVPGITYISKPGCLKYKFATPLYYWALQLV